MSMVTTQLLRRQTPQDQARELRRGCLDRVEIVLEQQRIRVRLDDEVDRVCRLIQWRFALELTGFATLADDVDQDLLKALCVGPGRGPPFTGRRGGDVVELPVVEKQGHSGCS